MTEFEDPANKELEKKIEEDETAKIIKAIDEFSAAMKTKMLEKMKEGWTGWRDPKLLPMIRNGMTVHVGRFLAGNNNEYVDLGIYSMMMHRHTIPVKITGKDAWKQEPCLICDEPVTEESTSGREICPWCAMGKCRYCGITLVILKKEIDGGKSIREVRDHMKWHKGIK